MEICFSDIYEKTLSFFSIESVLSNNYRLFGLNNHGNLYQNLFILDALYKLKKWKLTNLKTYVKKLQ